MIPLNCLLRIQAVHVMIPPQIIRCVCRYCRVKETALPFFSDSHFLAKAISLVFEIIRSHPSVLVDKFRFVPNSRVYDSNCQKELIALHTLSGQSQSLAVFV